MATRIDLGKLQELLDGGAQLVLELLGFTQVHDYMAGKADWLAYGLPTEGEPLLGGLRKAMLEADPATRAEQVMEAGPSTVRADRPLAELAERLRDRGLRTAVVTGPDGKLLGVARRADMEAQLAAQA
jgi:CBS-domain-containing membrane protein